MKQVLKFRGMETAPRDGRKILTCSILPPFVFFIRWIPSPMDGATGAWWTGDGLDAVEVRAPFGWIGLDEIEFSREIQEGAPK